MLDNVPELFDLAVTLAYAVLGAGLLGGGVLAELRGLTSLTGGEFVFGLWLAGVGVVAMAAGAMLFTDKVRARLAA